LATVTAAAIFFGCGGEHGPRAATSPAEEANTLPPAEVEAPAKAAGAANDEQLNERLTQPAEREEAVAALVIAYAEAAKHGSHTESARSFVAQHAATATRVYVDGREQLSPSTRKQLLRTLVSFDSETAVPAFIEAIQQYARTGESVDDAIWACQGVMQRRVPQYGAPLLEAYLALDPGDKDGHRYSRHLAAAMEYQVDAEWVPTLSEELAKPLERPTRFDDTGAVKAFRRALFRQTVAARLLGDLQVQQAVDPLLYVLIDQGKPEIHPAAELSLAKLAEYALPRMLSLLRREDEQLVRLGAQAKPDVGPSHVYFATKWLDLIRHPSTEK